MDPLVRMKFRVKLRSLAEESRIIREYEKKCGRQVSDLVKAGKPHDKVVRVAGSITAHRRFVVRREARHTLVAYAYVRGVPFHVIESGSQSPLFVKDVCRIVGSLARVQVSEETIQSWILASFKFKESVKS